MELRQLKYFVKVAETLNFSEAAKALFVTQSTLSQQVKQLEDSLGAQLLSRTSHSVALTEAGTELLPFAQRTLLDADLCQQRIHDLEEGLGGFLNIGVTYSFSPILTESLFSFMSMYPKVKLNILYKPMSELMDLLVTRNLDFVLAFKPSQPLPGVESHYLFQNYLAVIVADSHPLAKEKSVSFEMLKKYDLALPSQGLQARNLFDRIIGDRISDFRVKIELNEVNILLKLLRPGRLASVLAEATILNESGVIAIPFVEGNGEMNGCVHTLTDSYRKKSMQEFIKILSSSLAVRARQNAWL